MSLASRISSFFTASSPASQDTSLFGSPNRGGADNNRAGVNTTNSLGNHGAVGVREIGSANMAVEDQGDDLSSKRPPYLHVCLYLSSLGFSFFFFLLF